MKFNRSTYTLFILSVLTIILLFTYNIPQEEKVIECKTYLEEESQVEEEIIVSVPRYNINLSEHLQEYTYYLSEECPDVDYELILSVLYTESKFDANTKNINRSGSVDRGIAQINSNYTKHYAEVSGYYKDFNPFNPEHGIKACVYKLQELAEFWKKNGTTDKEKLEIQMVESYNKGVTGYKNYIKSNNTDTSKYSNLVLTRKNELLTEGEFITL